MVHIRGVDPNVEIKKKKSCVHSGIEKVVSLPYLVTSMENATGLGI